MKTSLIYVSILAIFCSVSCNKTDFLDQRPVSNIIQPVNLADLQSILDFQAISAGSLNISPGIGALSTDVVFIPESVIATNTQINRNIYLFAKDIWQGAGSQADWNSSFNQIYKSNLVLEKVSSISDPDLTTRNYIAAQAYFFRARAIFDLAQLYAPYYDSSRAITDLGLPLKLNSDINITVQRASVKQTYDQIFNDLSESQQLMSVPSPGTLKNRPTKAGLFALTAQVYLYLRMYESANTYADSALKYSNTLIDFSTLSTTSTSPFGNPLGNTEIIFFSGMNTTFPLASGTSIGGGGIDTLLYRSYDNNDLRKAVYFSVISGNLAKRKSDYAAAAYPFTGLAVDELYLIKAECLARSGNYTSAMQWLNNLLRTRFKKVGSTTTYVDMTSSTSADALTKILVERKKELLFRSRWGDLRRLNKEGANIIVSRMYTTGTYALQPNSSLFTFPIPPDEIALSGILQNAR
jgi:tetratricopeptide (TPR) repeat protein